MNQTARPVIAIDCMGGDFAPSAIAEGILQGIRDHSDVEIIAVGNDSVVNDLSLRSDRITAIVTSEVIAMDDHPAAAVRAKQDSSIAVGARLVKEGEADAFFSAGNTGATMAAATLIMGRVGSVSRPAIATVIPTLGNPVVFLDVGANADCKPEHLVQFAHMGSAYAKTTLHVESPRIALLNIGAEETKGSALALDAYKMLKDSVPGFIGNVEGNDIPAGICDVIVTDGFTGNVTLKLMEGLTSTLMKRVKSVMTDSTLTRLGAIPARSGFEEIRAHLDPEAHGGAPLLGVDGVCIIGHGSSSAKAVSNAIGVAAEAVRGELVSTIERATTPA